MKKLLIVVDAPGPAEFIGPVIPLLKYYELKIVTVKESPTKVLAKYNPTRIDKESEAEPIYRKFDPDALLIAVSSLVTGPYVSRQFTELAHRDGKKIICFQDLWGNHRWPANFEMMRYWDSILTLDKLAERLLKESGYQGKIYPTGSPAFDNFKKVDITKERQQLRKKFGIPEKTFVIFYAGAATPAGWREDETTFKFLAEAVHSFQKNNPDSLFIAHPHPRDEKPGRYQRIAPNLKYFDLSKFKIDDQLLPMMDVIVGMYATNLIHACYLRIPGVSILLPDAGGKRLFENLSLDDFPTNQMGATIGVYKPNTDALIKILEKIKTDPAFVKKFSTNQKKYFSLGGKTAAEKAAVAIKNSL